MALRILVADNETIAGFDLCDTFEEAGFRVAGPHTGAAETMRACTANRPDLAVLDIELANGSAYQLAQALIDDNVPVILHSGRADASAVAARFPGATTLIKPCPPAQLLGAVSRALASG